MIETWEVDEFFEQLDALIELHVSFKTISKLMGKEEADDLDFSSDAKNIRDVLAKALLYTKAMCTALAELQAVISNHGDELNSLVKWNAVSVPTLMKAISERAIEESRVIRKLNKEGQKLGFIKED